MIAHILCNYNAKAVIFSLYIDKMNKLYYDTHNKQVA